MITPTHDLQVEVGKIMEVAEEGFILQVPILQVL